MTDKLGRLLDHVHLRARDFEASRRFYRAAFEALGVPFEDDGRQLHADEFYMDAGRGSTVHLAFQARDRQTVHRFYEAVLAAGGTDNGAPGERDYHPGYYACFVLDPDGNNVEAVFHGPTRRSAAAIEVERV